MTVSTTSNFVTLLGNGVTTVFSYNFIGVASADLSVTFTDTDGTQTLLTPTQYTLTMNPISLGGIWSIGGTVTYPLVGSPIANGTSLTIVRTLPLTQTTSISNQGDFYPQVVEAALDTLCMEIQQVANASARSIQAPTVDVNPQMTLPAASVRAGKFVSFDGSGNVIVSSGTTSGGINPLAPYFTPTGSALPPSGNGMYAPSAQSIGIASNGNIGLLIENDSSSVNYLRIAGEADATPSAVVLSAAGASTHCGLAYTTKGTTVTPNQYNGNTASTSGTHDFFINGQQCLQITDTYWNPNDVYTQLPTAWPVLSSGALAGGPDNIAVISCNSSLYPGTATGVTLMYMAKGPTGAHHFTNNGVIAHVTIPSLVNPLGNDQFCAANELQLSGSASGSGGPALIYTNYATVGDSATGMLFYNEGTGGFVFQADNTTSAICQLNRVANAVNNVNIQGAAAGGNPVVFAGGGAGNIRLSLSGVDDAGVDICNRSGQYPIAKFSAGFAPADYLQVTAGTSVTLAVAGTGTDVSLILAAKGANNVHVNVGNLVLDVAAKGLVLKQGANGKCGTFILTGTTPVTVANTNIAITDSINPSLNTVGGTVGAVPSVKTITAASGFTVAGSAGDTSTYNYNIISNAA